MVLALRSLPTALGDCNPGSTQNSNTCFNGQNTHPSATGQGHDCANGGSPNPNHCTTGGGGT
jgi:hypothetical protein